MSCYLRPRMPGACILFTVTLSERGSDILVREVAALRDAVRRTRRERPFGIGAWVVLPDHMHCIWHLPPGDADYSTRWGAIKARFTMSVRRAGFTPPPRLPTVLSGRYAGVNPGLRHHKGEAGLWQRRFWEHHIRSTRDWTSHVRYCWMNPVKHGLVTDPSDWPYSSWHRDRNARGDAGAR